MTSTPTSPPAAAVSPGSAAAAVVDAFLDGDGERYLSLCAPDALLDLVVPRWRFQVVGIDALREVLAEEFLPGRTVHERHVTATQDGVLLEVAATAQAEGHDVTWWAMHHIRIRDGLVHEHIAYCSGWLDEATAARQSVEAPMVRAR